MNNYVQPGKAINLDPAPVDMTSGRAYLIGELFGIAAKTSTTAAGGDNQLWTEGVFTHAKAAEAVVVGDPAYWDDTAKVFTKTGPADGKAGVFVVAAASGEVGTVYLPGVVTS